MSSCSNNDYPMLILKCQLSDDEDFEVNCIENSCKLMGLTPEVKQIKNFNELEKVLQKKNKYDFIYLSAHGDSNGFYYGEEEEENPMSWRDFALELCENENLNKDCIVMLSCCRGGLNEVAYTLFYICSQIEFVVGPRQKLPNCELGIAFTVFLFNYLERSLDAVESAIKVRAGMGTRLICFDRLETRTTSSYLKYIEDNLEEPDDEYFNELIVDKIVTELIRRLDSKESNSIIKKNIFSTLQVKSKNDPISSIENGNCCLPNQNYTPPEAIKSN